MNVCVEYVIPDKPDDLIGDLGHKILSFFGGGGGRGSIFRNYLWLAQCQ